MQIFIHLMESDGSARYSQMITGPLLAFSYLKKVEKVSVCTEVQLLQKHVPYPLMICV